MPSPKKSKSPSRTTRSRARSKSAGRSRSRSSGRKSKSASATDSSQVKVVSSSTKTRKSSRSPSRMTTQETIITKRVVSSGQEDASVTPTRASSRIASLIAKEKEESKMLVNQMKSDMLASIKTPPKLNSDEPVMKDRRKKGFHYEFMGPVGAFLMIFLLPATVYYINMACRKKVCSIMSIPKFPTNWVGAFFEVEAALLFLGWFAFQAFLAVLPVGQVVQGQPLKSGGRLNYRCNGFFALLVSLVAVLGAVYLKCPVTKVVDKFFKLMTAATVFSFTLSICLYVKSRLVPASKLAAGGNSGNPIYDFFMGRELNPRIGPLDLKFFCELRPGLIGWVILDWLMLVKAHETTGTFPPNLVLVTVFQTLYVADALWFEDAILTTMDIIHDGFGFMLVFGDLVWVPFLYSLQPRFLLETSFTLPWYCLAPIALLNLGGYAIFRLSNSQKNRFRQNPKNPELAGLETIPTQTGKKLLVGGWWGLCRKPNYLGDLIMACAWSLTTGLTHLFPYFYPLYFLVLLIHRERRDNEQCQQKYGASWDRYCERVKYRIFPRIY